MVLDVHILEFRVYHLNTYLESVTFSQTFIKSNFFGLDGLMPACWKCCPGKDISHFGYTVSENIHEMTRCNGATWINIRRRAEGARVQIPRQRSKRKI